MPVNIHPSARSRLSEFLIERLPNIEIYSGMMLHRQSLSSINGVDDILDRKTVDYAANFIDESPLFDFIADYLDRLFEDKLKWDSDKKRLKITEFQELPSVKQIAEEIIDSFLHLPSDYVLSIKYPQKFEVYFPDQDELIFSPEVSIIRPDENHKLKYPYITGDPEKDRRNHGLSLLFLGEPQHYEWDDTARYITIRKSGHLSRFAETFTGQSAISTLKSFFGLGLAIRLFRKKQVYSPSPRILKIIPHKYNGSKWEIQNSIEIQADISHTIDSLEYESFILDRPELAPGIVKKEYQTIQSLFSHAKNERILLACTWYFDSHVGHNELLSFIQAMISLEILLGDKAISDSIGLNELLSNRCAYLIGKSQSQRDELMEEFRDIYDIRSQIVHRGKSRLSNKERRLMWKLIWICGRVIQEEVRLASADDRDGLARS